MLLIIYIPVTRERESGRSVRIGRENGMEREQEGDLWYPRSGEPRSGNSPHSPLLHLSVSLFLFCSFHLPLSPDRAVDSKDSQIYCQREEGKCRPKLIRTGLAVCMPAHSPPREATG